MFAGIFAVKAARIAREVSRGIRRKQTHCACRRLPLNIFVSANPTWRLDNKTLTHHFLKTSANQNLKFGNSFYYHLIFYMTKNEGKLCFCVLAFRNTLSGGDRVDTIGSRCMCCTCTQIFLECLCDSVLGNAAFWASPFPNP